MDIQRKDAGKKRLIRRIVIGIVLVAAVAGTSVVVGRLKPAAPSVDLSVVWRDTVKRGPMTRDVRGLGTLVPEETMLIPATTEGRVQRILIRPGTPVKANSVVMILTSQELETDLLNAEYAMKAAEADYANLKVTLGEAESGYAVDGRAGGCRLQHRQAAGRSRRRARQRRPVQRGGRQNFSGEGRSTGQPPATRTETHLHQFERRRGPVGRR